MKKALYWGRNENHQFWESEDRELLILCNHHESFWTVHRNYGFLFSCDSAEEGANKVNAELCRERIWARQSDSKFSLVAAKDQVSLQDTLIPPVPDDNVIPDDATCQEASILSANSYIPCGDTAVAIVYHPKDNRKYFMCASCTDHNVRNRGGQLIARKSI